MRRQIGAIFCGASVTGHRTRPQNRNAEALPRLAMKRDTAERKFGRVPVAETAKSGKRLVSPETSQCQLAMRAPTAEISWLSRLCR